MNTGFLENILNWSPLAMRINDFSYVVEIWNWFAFFKCHEKKNSKL